MKGWRIVAVIILCSVLTGCLACSSLGNNNQEGTDYQLVNVTRGDLTVTVGGSGNIGVANEARLTFGSGGKVDKIYVKEGDEVTKGDVLARLDTTALELALTQARVAVTTANVTLETARYNLNQALELYTWPEIKTALADVEDAEAYVDYAAWNLDQATTAEEENQWTATLAYAQIRLATAKAKLDAITRSYDTDEVVIKKQELELAQQSLEQAQQSLDYSQKQLDEATITAPIDGLVAGVYVKEGDITPSPTMTAKTIVYLIDPISMELKAEVDEIDIPLVELEQRAVIEVDALSSFPLEGKVASVCPVPTSQTGIVVYDVTIDIDVPTDSDLMVGMSATVDIITAEQKDVLLVPNRAIKQDSQGNPIAEVMANGEIQQRSVVTGISDGFQTEIVDGLQEGESVVVRQTKSQSSGLGLF